MYEFKRLPESVRSILIAVGIVVAQMIATTDFSAIESWHVWLVALGVAALHAFGVAMLGVLTRSKSTSRAKPPAS